MTTRKNKHKLNMSERISIIICLCVSAISFTILCMVLAMRQPAIEEEILINHENNYVEAEAETTSPANAHKHKMIYFENYVETEEPHATESEEIIPVIENLQNSVSEWCLANEDSKEITVWKMTDRAGNLLIALKNNEDQFIVTFKYEGVESEYYDGWTLCDKFFATITTSDIIDYAYTAYHEVSGRNAMNVQAQTLTFINRQKCEIYPNSARGVITQGGQYACSRNVVNRWIKGGNGDIEREDLDKCFRQVLLVLAGELIQEVPSNVVFAAQGYQGSGVWMIIDGTYYCYL